MKKTFILAGAALFPLLAPFVHAQGISIPSVVVIKAPETSDLPQVFVLAAGSQATVSIRGGAFEKLKKGEVLEEGAVIRTGEKTVVDLFLRRWGTSIRMLPESELLVEKLTKNKGTNSPTLEAGMHLRAGRIFCFLRAPVADSKFEVRTAAGRSHIDSASAGRYDIRADGTIVTGKSAFNQVRLITENGVKVIAPGQSFNAKDGHIAPAAPSDVEMLVIEMDQLAALAEQYGSEEKAKKIE